LNEFSLSAVGHGDRLGAAPRDFKHGAEGALFGAADGAACHHVSGAEVATVDGVVGQLLAHVPIHVTKVGTANDLAGGSSFWNDFDFERHVVVAVAFVLQVIENLGVLLWARDAKVVKGFEGDDPRGDGGAEVLAEEGAEGDVFPLLDVAGGPVVEEHKAKNVVLRLGCRDPLAERFAVEGDEGHLEFEVEETGRAEDRGLVVAEAGLAHGTADGRAADDDAGGPAVVSHWHVLPVGEQGVVRVAKHLADVPGVVLAGIEIRVVAHFHRHVHGDGRGGNEARRVKVGAVSELGRVGSEQGLDALAQGDRGRLAELHQGIQDGCGKDVVGEAEAVEEACGVEGAEVNDVVAQPHPGTGIAVGRRENAKREIGEREIVPRWHVDPRGQVRVGHGAKVVHAGGFMR